MALALVALWTYADAMHRRWLLALAPCLAALWSCGGPSTGAQDTAMRDLKNAHQRVEGSWRLTSFTPSAPLGAPFDALVNDQVGRLELTMAGGTLTTSGVGFAVDRRYEIVSATPDAAQAVIIDDAGVRYDLDLLFQGQQIQFVSKTDPWRGQGTLTRVP